MRINIRSFFTLTPISSRISRLFTSSRNNFTSGIVELLLDLYTKRYKCEEIALSDVVDQYRLLGVVDVIIGTSSGELYYVIREPVLTQSDICKIIQKFQEHSSGWGESELNSELQDSLSITEYNYLKVYSGLGPLLPFIIDDKIEDLSLNRVSGRVYVVHRDFSWYGWIKSNVIVDPGLVDRLAMTISRKAGKHLSLTQPLVEGSVKSSIRASIVYSDVISAQGTSIVIRKKPSELWTITKLINEGVITTELASYLWLVLEKHGWIIVAGPVGSGKTTLLQAVLTMIPPHRKVIIIEDTPELTATSELWDVFAERVEVFSQVSPIDSYTLLKFALRRRPDYIVIGEVRGIEARLLIQASRLGHGVLNTIHADSPESVIQRLTAPPISIPKNLLSNIWTIILMGVIGNKRRIVRVSEVLGNCSLVDVYDASRESYVDIDHLVSQCERLKLYYNSESLRELLLERALFLERLVARGFFSHQNLAEKIAEYYTAQLHRVVSH